jgi:hypothetical protein
MRSLLLVALAAALGFPADAQEQKADSTKKDLPLKTERTVKLTTDEGTWLSLDVSPARRRASATGPRSTCSHGIRPMASRSRS